MVRRLSAEERALWRKVTMSVKPLAAAAALPAPAEADPLDAPTPPAAPLRHSRPPVSRAAPVPVAAVRPGTTLDGGWDRRLARGLVAPDLVVDLHGHSLAGAHDRLEAGLADAVARDARLLLLVTGKPPVGDRRPVMRGVIRASVGDWLAHSRHAADIAAIRNAHPRHGGAGALYIVLRRRRAKS